MPRGRENRRNGHPYEAEERKVGVPRPNLPRDSVNIMLQWLADHVEYPFPSDQEKRQLQAETGIKMDQVNYWFINARRRNVIRTGSVPYVVDKRIKSGDNIIFPRTPSQDNVRCHIDHNYLEEGGDEGEEDAYVSDLDSRVSLIAPDTPPEDFQDQYIPQNEASPFASTPMRHEETEGESGSITPPPEETSLKILSELASMSDYLPVNNLESSQTRPVLREASYV